MDFAIYFGRFMLHEWFLLRTNKNTQEATYFHYYSILDKTKRRQTLENWRICLKWKREASKPKMFEEKKKTFFFRFSEKFFELFLSLM